MSRRRASLSSQRSSIHTSTTAFVDDALFHVSQRLDALAADDEHAFLYFSRVVTPPLRSNSANANNYDYANTNANISNNYDDANANLFNTNNATTNSSSDNSSASHRYGYHNYHHHHHSQTVPPVPPQRMRTATITTRRRRRRRQALVARVLGLSAFYARFALLIGLGWFLTAYAVLATTLVMRDSPSAVHLTLSSSSSSSSSISASVDTQRGRELAALAIGAALGGPLCGSLADHYGRRRVLLLTTATWVVCHIASAFAWSHVALLASRALSGLGLGGQVALFSIVLSEFAAQRRRGRIVVMGMACAPLGALTAVHTAQRLVDLVRWRVFTAAIVGGAGVLYLVALFVFLHDSPRFLAAIGRTDAAMELVEAIERAHGINRNARVTMPSSLYEPPAQHQNQNQQINQRHSSRASRVSSSTRLPSAPYGPGFPWRLTSHSRSRSHTQTTHTMHTPYQTQMQHQQRQRRRMSVALTPGMVSIGVSLGKRWQRVLWCRPYAWRSLGLALLWLCVSLGLSTTVACAARFSRRHRTDSSSSESEVASSSATTLLLVVVPTCVTLAAFVGLLLSALLIDRCGRVPLVLVSVLVSSLATTMLGMHLFLALDGVAFLAAACSLLALAGVVALSTATVWTLECFGVLIRATGMGLVFSASCVGIALGQWLAWSDALLAMESCLHFVLWGVAAAFLVVALVVWLCGVETRGLEDVDSVVVLPAAATTTANETTATGGHGVSTLHEQQRQSTTSTSDKHTQPPPLPPLPPLPPPSIASKNTSSHRDDDQCTETTDELQDDPSYPTYPHQTQNPNQTGFPRATGPSSDASTSVGSSSIPRSSSSVRFSSQRTLSSRGTRGSSLTRQQQNQQNQQNQQDTRASLSSSSSFAPRRRESSSGSPYLAGIAIRRSSATATPPPFVIRRSSLTRQQQLLQQHEDDDDDHDTLRIVRTAVRRAREPSSFGSFGSGRLTFADLPHSRPAARLDPHSVREHRGRRSSQDESSILSSSIRSSIRSSSNNRSSSSSSSSDSLGVGPEHDMLTIEIDPYDDHNGFVTMHTPMPMLG